MSCTLRVLFACAAVAACDRAPVTIAVATPGTRTATRALPGAPHGAVVELVAVTEAGDVALTADDVGTVRLWPALDGTREAIPIAALAPRELALATSGDELVAGVLDQARVVHVMRLRRDGTLRARAQVPDGPEVRQVVAAGGDVLVRRADESIERYDGAGTLHGRIVAPPGARVGTIAVRGNAAIASIVAGDDRDAGSVRWIELGDTLAWGEELALPARIAPAPLALAPGRHRLAVVSTAPDPKQPVLEPPGSPAARPLQILRLGASVTPYAMPGIEVEGGAAIGFIDDDHVAVANRNHTSWWNAAPDDPWIDPGTVGRGHPFGVRLPGASAIGDRVLVGGYAAGLELENSKVTRYLGWGALSFGQVTTMGDRVTDGPADGKFVWLDARLVETQAVMLDKLHQPPPHMVTAIGDREVAIAYVEGDQVRVELVDTANLDRRHPLGAYSDLERIDFDPARGILALLRSDRIERWQLDVAKLTARKLDALHYYGTTGPLRLLDPARADGADAMLVTYEDDGQQVRVYRDGSDAVDRVEASDGTVIAIDDTGTIYARPTAHPTWIVAHRGGHELGHFELPGATDIAAASHDGASLAIARAGDITLVDASGTVRWQHPLWKGLALAFIDGDRRVIVRTATGIVALDAATGDEVSRACGWEFGLHDTPLPSVTYGQPPVCEDSGP